MSNPRFGKYDESQVITVFDLLDQWRFLSLVQDQLHWWQVIAKIRIHFYKELIQAYITVIESGKPRMVIRKFIPGSDENESFSEDS